MGDTTCTGLSARWCPRCGDCTCGSYIVTTTCPLHSASSRHSDDHEESADDIIARLTRELDAARAALLEYVPRCPDCDAPATRRSDGDAYDHRSRLHCDACAPADAGADVLHADAIRSATVTR
jgi:hypothetical protein